MSSPSDPAARASPHPGVHLPDTGGRRPLRLLMLAPQPYFQQRGTPIAVRNLLDVLVRRGYDIRLLTYPEGEDPANAGYRIERVGRRLGFRGIRPGFSVHKVILDMVMLRRAVRLCRAWRPDVVHAVEEAAFISLSIQRIFGIPYVYDMDSSLADQLVERYPSLRIVKPVLARLERFAMRNSVGILAVCQALEENARSSAPPALIHRIEDVSLLPDGEPASELLRQTTGSDAPIVLYVGNLEPYQGLDLLLAAFRRIPDEVAAQLVVIGGSPPSIQAYRERARQAGLDGRAHFLGPRPLSALGWYLRQADIVVSPRITGNNTPMKVYSYLDSGTALLATRLPTHTQVLDDSIALLVDPEPQAMAEGLTRLLADDCLRSRLACEAAERVRQEFSQEAFDRKVNAFYDAVEDRLAAPSRRDG